MHGPYRLSENKFRPRDGGRGRILLIIGMLLAIFTIIYLTWDTKPTPNPRPRKTARGQ